MTNKNLFVKRRSITGHSFIFRSLLTLILTASMFSASAQRVSRASYDQQNAGYYISTLIVEKIFDGGTHLRSDVWMYDYNDGTHETRIHFSFNGNIVSTNFYETTLVLSNNSPYVHFENSNDIAGIYLGFKAVQVVGELLDTLNHENNEEVTSND